MSLCLPAAVPGGREPVGLLANFCGAEEQRGRGLICMLRYASAVTGPGDQHTPNTRGAGAEPACLVPQHHRWAPRCRTPEVRDTEPTCSWLNLGLRGEALGEAEVCWRKEAAKELLYLYPAVWSA